VRDAWEARPDPPQTTRARPGWAVAGAVAVFLIAYGLQAVSAFMLYPSPAASADRASASTTMVDEAIRGQLAQLYVAAVVAGGIVLVTMPRGLRLRDYQQKIPGQRGGAAMTAAGVMVALLVSQLTSSQPNTRRRRTRWSTRRVSCHLVLAGLLWIGAIGGPCAVPSPSRVGLAGLGSGRW